MSTHRKIDRATAERLLAGGPAGPATDRLARLLAAAAAPDESGDTDGGGEQAVLLAFRQAQLTGSPLPRRRHMLKLAIAKLLTAKVAAIAATATVAGGVALATTGNLPNPINGLGASSATVDRDQPGSEQSDRGQPGRDQSDRDLPGPDGLPTPSPSLSGLCQAFLAGSDMERGRALRSPAFQVLIRAAGAEEKVEGYCADLSPGDPGERGDAVRPTDLPTPRDLPPASHPSPGPPDHEDPPHERPGPPGDR